MTCGIYQIRNLIDGKCYIGQSNNLRKRRTQHLHALRSGRHCNRHLQHAWDKYGESTFVFEILKVCPVDTLTDEEQRALDATPHNTRYNVGDDVSVPCRGVPKTDEHKNKIRTAHLGRPKTESHRRQIARALGARPLVGVALLDTTQRIYAECPSALRSRGFRPLCVSAVARGHRRSHRGYVWLFQDEASEAAIVVAIQKATTLPDRSWSQERRMHASAMRRGKTQSPEARRRTSKALGGRAVEGFDPLTLEVRQRFAYLSLAKQAGFDPSSICATIRRRIRTHKGLCWRYVDEVP